MYQPITVVAMPWSGSRPVVEGLAAVGLPLRLVQPVPSDLANFWYEDGLILYATSEPERRFERYCQDMALHGDAADHEAFLQDTVELWGERPVVHDYDAVNYWFAYCHAHVVVHCDGPGFVTALGDCATDLVDRGLAFTPRPGQPQPNVPAEATLIQQRHYNHPPPKRQMDYDRPFPLHAKPLSPASR